MKNNVYLLLICIFTTSVIAQEMNQADMEKGFNFIETKIYSQEEDTQILELYRSCHSSGLD